ncbi:hypothetical protein DVH05_006770 [Phytophthora capsici]|nr:hypothetical protein DVH05_006770 [Phytophthora capsici]
MLNDAQAKYHETVSSGYQPKFVSSSVQHMRSKVVGSPVEFKPLPKFVREDFLLSDEEAREFLTMPSPLGLPDEMTKEQDFMELVVRECNGLIGALRGSVDAMAAHFAKYPAESETELFLYLEVLRHDASVVNT